MADTMKIRFNRSSLESAQAHLLDCRRDARKRSLAFKEPAQGDNGCDVCFANVKREIKGRL
jgi:hypothetical protein